MKQIIHDNTMGTKTVAMIDDLVNGRFNTELVNEYQLQNYDWSKPVTVAVAELNRADVTGESFAWDSTTDLITEKIRKRLLNYFDSVIVGNNESTFTILVSFSKSKLPSATSILKNELTCIFRESQRENIINSFFAGIGSTQSELQKMGMSYEEAISAKSIAKSFLKKGPIVLYEDLGIYRIISMIHDREELKNFCGDFLAELELYDEKNKDVLVETLSVYLQCGCIIQEIAKKLFIHPNTVVYRLKKIQNVVKHDLNSWEVRFTYLFALEAAGILHRQGHLWRSEQESSYND